MASLRGAAVCSFRVAASALAAGGGSVGTSASVSSALRSGFLKRVAGSWRCPGLTKVPARALAETSYGTILPKPEKVPLGLTKVFTVVIPFLIIGAIASKKGAELLEEHDIFVPDDDDDDD